MKLTDMVNKKSPLIGVQDRTKELQQTIVAIEDFLQQKIASTNHPEAQADMGLLLSACHNLHNHLDAIPDMQHATPDELNSYVDQHVLPGLHGLYMILNRAQQDD